MRLVRLYHSCRMLLLRTPGKRAQYLKEHNILGAMGDDCRWGPWLIPLYPKLIKIHNNVHVHKTAHIVTHDVLNAFLKKRSPDVDYGHYEHLGCVELMDNVVVSMNVTIMPDVRINKDCIISAGSIVNTDIPENSIASGVPAKVIGRLDMYAAVRRMSKGQNIYFKNQELPDELAEQQWVRFNKKHQAK